MTIRINSGNNDGFEGSLGDKDLKEGDTFSFKSDNPIEIFLYAMQTKGARICDNIEITSEGEVYLNDGSAMSSIIKETELVFGKFVDGVFQPLNPADKFVNSLNSGTQDLVLNPVSDSMYGGDTLTLSEGIQVTGTASDGKWYLRLTRPNGSILYKEMKGINDMFDSTMDDRINSIPEVLKQLHDLGVAVKTVMEQNQFSRMQDVDNLENNIFDAFIISYKASIEAIQHNLSNQASAADLALYSEMIGNVENAKLSIQGTFDYNHGAASVTFASLLNNNTVTTIFELGNGENTLRPSIIDPNRHDIKNWLVKAVVHDPDDGMIINDSIWHKAYIENGQIKVDVRAVDCQELVAGRTVEVTVSYAGPMAAIDSTTATMVEVSFNTDGGSSLTPDDVIFGKTFGELPVPLKEGHSFEGWYTGPNGAGELVTSLSYVTSSSSITLYAKWSASYVTLSFDSNGGSSCTDTEVIPSIAYGTLCAPTRAGYTFGGWHDGEDINTLESFPSLRVRRSQHAMVKLQSGKIMVMGGFNDELGYLSSVEIYDPQTNQWTDGPSMNYARSRMTATLLSTDELARPEMFVPSSNDGGGGWQLLTEPSPSASFARAYHTATLIESGINVGKVLIAGGYNNGPLSTSYLYNPSDDTWSSSLTGFTSRERHTATCLDDGRVLVTGGYTTGYLNTCLIFDSSSNSWTSTNGFITSRADHTATKLNDGTVLVTGGFNGSYLSTVQTFEPSSSIWTTRSSLATARYRHMAIMLTSGLNQGKVLITGGVTSSAAAGFLFLSSTELFNPSDNSWSLSHPSLVNERNTATAACLNDGRVIVVGGFNGGDYLSSVEGYDLEKSLDPVVTFESIVSHIDDHTLYADWDLNSYTITYNSNGGSAPSPSTYTIPFNTSYQSFATTSKTGYGFIGWYEGNNFDVSSSTNPMSIIRASHTSTRLSDGKVLVTGGTSLPITSASTPYISSAEVYDPETETWETVGSFVGGRAAHTATLITSGPKAGYVLVAGGNDGTTTRLATAYLYNPTTKQFESAGSLNTGRYLHRATLLADGKRVLITGGVGTAFNLNTSQIYDSETNTWSSEQTFAGSGRYNHTATLLTSGPYIGNVLLIGGFSGTSFLSDIKLFDPNGNSGAGSWSTPLDNSGFISRASHTANILPDGRILIIGGSTFGITTKSVQILSSNLMNWTNLKKTTIGFSSHESFLLNGDKVLIVGAGYAQVYDYANDIWGSLSSLNNLAFVLNTRATLLSDGDNILITGGSRSSSSTVSYKEAEILNITQLQTSSPLIRSEIMMSTPSNHTLFAKWGDLPIYALTFDSRLGSSVSSKTVIKGYEYGFLSSPTRTGYTFDGWWTGINGTGTQVTANTIVTATASHTIYAKWLANYTITYDVQGGIACSPTTKTVVFSQAYGTLCTPTRTGFTFDGWYTGIGGTGSLITSNSTVNITSNQTLYAKWLANYTVTYNVQGGVACSPTTKTVVFSQTYGTLCTPTREFFAFDGWYTGIGGTGSLITSNSTVNITSNQTLYAKWLALITVTYDVQGGVACSPTLKVIETGQAYGSLCTPTRAGYTFDGWHDINPNKRWTSGPNLTPAGMTNLHLLSNNKVLSISEWLRQPELYDRSTNSWSNAGINPNITGNGLTVKSTVLLDGRIFVSGGTTNKFSIYNPNDNTWSTNIVSPYPSYRSPITATLDDGRVLVYGGSSSEKTTHIYNPNGNTWSTTGDSVNGHISTISILTNLQDGTGRILLTGGSANPEIYNPSTGTWTALSTNIGNRIYHTVTKLNNGNFLIVGGGSLASYIYSPSNGIFTTINSVGDKKWHSAVKLSNGDVLISGGYDINNNYSATSVIFDNQSQNFLFASSNDQLSIARAGHGACLLDNGAVLIAGGYIQNYDINVGDSTTRTTEVWSDATPIQINSSSTVNLNYSHTIYAKWLANTYTITYDVQGGISCSPTTKNVTNGLTYGTLCTPTKTGFIFDGWYTAINGAGVRILSNSIVDIVSNQTLYAYWIKNRYTIGTDSTGITNSSTSYPAPYGGYYQSNRQQYYITASQLSTAGLSIGKNITSIGFNLVSNNTSKIFRNFQLKVYTTSLSDPLNEGYITSTLVAASAITNFDTNSGWNQHVLENAFTWNGTSNLVVEICFGLNETTNEGYYNEYTSITTSGLGTGTWSRWSYSDTVVTCSLTTSNGSSTTTRPVMRFTTSN